MTGNVTLKPVLRARIFIHSVKTIGLLCVLSSGSLWCAWQKPQHRSSQSITPKNTDVAKHLAITRRSLPPICMNQNTFLKTQATLQLLRFQQSHYVVLAAVGDKDIVIKLCCCSKHGAVNQKCISMDGSAEWLAGARTSGLEGKTVRGEKNKLTFFLWRQLSFFLWLPIVPCPTFWYQLHTSQLYSRCWRRTFLSVFISCQHFVSLCCGD